MSPSRKTFFAPISTRRGVPIVGSDQSAPFLNARNFMVPFHEDLLTLLFSSSCRPLLCRLRIWILRTIRHRSSCSQDRVNLHVFLFFYLSWKGRAKRSRGSQFFFSNLLECKSRLSFRVDDWVPERKLVYYIVS